MAPEEGSAQDAAVQEAMQLMFGQNGPYLPADSQAGFDQGISTNKPALMQRLSVLARGPADSPSFRPFNMLGTPDTMLGNPNAMMGTPNAMLGGPDMASSSQLATQSPDQASLDAVMQSDWQPVDGDITVGDGALAFEPPQDQSQNRLSMTGMVTDPYAPWLDSGAGQEPLSLPRKSAKKSRKQSKAAKFRSDAAEVSTAAAAEDAAVEWDGLPNDVRPEFSFSPLGDSSSRLPEQDPAFSPLAAGAGQSAARPSIRQRIKKSLFGPSRESTPSSEAKKAKVARLLSKGALLMIVCPFISFTFVVFAWQLHCHCCEKALFACSSASHCKTAWSAFKTWN